MVLHAENWLRLVAHALVWLVVQVQVRDFVVARWQRFGINAESVILRGDFDLIRQKIFHWMVRTVVAEFQLECFAAERKAANLMTQADSEDWNFADELADIFYRVLHRFRIPGPVRKKNAVRI